MATHSVGKFIPETSPESIKNRAAILRTFWILLAITAVEFAIAFAKGPFHLNHLFVVIVFISLTVVKAFYIIAEFMHLKHEVKMLILAMALPVIFIIWFLFAMFYEGNAILMVR
jgi:cytochrome c oxidase subunit IV